MNRHLSLLFVAFCVLALSSDNARATSTASTRDLGGKYYKGSAASGGGTFVVTYASTTDRATWLSAKCGLSDVSATHLHDAGFLTAEYVVENKNGTLTAATSYSSSNNPSNASTTTFVAAHAQAADSAFTGGGPSTLAWSVTTPNAILTLTNTGATTADVTCLIEAFYFGSQ
jgi:hypothetical protein